MSSPVPGWYGDPRNAAQVRWWDGRAWTNETRELPAPDVSEPSHGASDMAFADTRAPVTYTDLGNESPGTAPLPSSGAPSPPVPVSPPAPGIAPPPGIGPATPPDARGKRTGLGLLVMLALVVVIMAAGYVVYSVSMGGGSGREPSSDAVKVYEGSAYSLEAPKDWKYVSGPVDNVEMSFIAPNGAVMSVGVSEEVSADDAEMSNPATRKIVFDMIIRVVTAVLPSSQVESRTDVDLGGVPGERVVMSGLDPTSGQVVRAEMYISADSSRFYAIELTGTPAATTDAAVSTAFRTAVASFRLE